MAGDTVTKLAYFNDFCKDTKEGDVLYNLDSTNSWGRYLLVVIKSVMCIDSQRTSFLTLFGLEKDEDGKLTPKGTRIDLTFDKVSSLPYLKRIGHCKYFLTPVLVEERMNENLEKFYKATTTFHYHNVHKCPKKKIRKWDTDGRKIVKDTNNI